MLLLPDTLTLHEAQGVLRLMKLSLEREAGPVLVVDGAQLQRFDSSAIAVLLECRRLAQAWGKGFELSAMPPKLLELVRLYGIDELLGAAPRPSAPTGPAEASVTR